MEMWPPVQVLSAFLPPIAGARQLRVTWCPGSFSMIENRGRIKKTDIDTLRSLVRLTRLIRIRMISSLRSETSFECHTLELGKVDFLVCRDEAIRHY